MGPPANHVVGADPSVRCAEDCEEIYDDVMPASFQRDNFDESDSPVPKQPLVKLRATSGAKASRLAASDDRYFMANNEYSSVDETHLGEEDRDELGVYDDVGLPEPAEERVNSLYAGSMPGYVSGLTSTNGKESEWEDVEEVASRDPCRGDDTW